MNSLEIDIAEAEEIAFLVNSLCHCLSLIANKSLAEKEKDRLSVKSLLIVCIKAMPPILNLAEQYTNSLENKDFYYAGIMRAKIELIGSQVMELFLTAVSMAVPESNYFIGLRTE